MKRNSILKLAYAAVCLALAMVLPLLTGQIPQVGDALAPYAYSGLNLWICMWMAIRNLGGIYCTAFTICYFWNAAHIPYGIVHGI